jgi:hypothetical protein
MRSDVIDLTVIIRHETLKAWLVEHGGKAQVWIPKSRADITPNSDGKTHTMTLQQSFAEEKEMV